MITLTKISETASKITLGWTPVSGAIGYRFQSSATAPKWSHTWDATKDQVTFGKAAWYKVEALGTAGVGQYPPITPPPPDPGPWTGPLRITQGGTYSGSWESSASNWDSGAVIIDTTEEVLLKNFRARNLNGGTVIWGGRAGVRVTLENGWLYGGPGWQTSGRAVIGWEQHSFRLYGVTIEHTRGIEFTYGDPAGELIMERVRHIRPAGGRWGLFGSAAVGNFVQFRHSEAATKRIAWCEVVQQYEPDSGGPTCEDVVSIYHTSGVEVLDSMFWHQSNPGNPYNMSSQGCITIDASDPGPPCDNVRILRNQVVDGYAIVYHCAYGGANYLAQDNRVVSDGYINSINQRNGSGWSTPLVILPNSSPNKHAHDNYVAQVDRDGTHPLDPWDAQYATHAAYGLRGADEGGNAEAAKNTYAPKPITKAMEDAEWTLWQQRQAANGVVIGAK